MLQLTNSNQQGKIATWLVVIIAIVVLLLVVQIVLLLIARPKPLTPQQKENIKRNEELIDATLLYIGTIEEITETSLTLFAPGELNGSRADKTLTVYFDEETSYSRLAEDKIQLASSSDIKVGDTILSGSTEDIGTVVEIKEDSLTLFAPGELNGSREDKFLTVPFDEATSFSRLAENKIQLASSSDIKIGDTILAGSTEDIAQVSTFYASRIQIKN